MSSSCSRFRSRAALGLERFCPAGGAGEGRTETPPSRGGHTTAAAANEVGNARRARLENWRRRPSASATKRSSRLLVHQRTRTTRKAPHCLPSEARVFSDWLLRSSRVSSDSQSTAFVSDLLRRRRGLMASDSDSEAYWFDGTKHSTAALSAQPPAEPPSANAGTLSESRFRVLTRLGSITHHVRRERVVVVIIALI